MALRLGPWGRRSTAEVAEPAQPEAEAQAGDSRRPCEQCGALLSFRPGTGELVCEYCGHANRIVDRPVEIVEHDLRPALERGLADAPMVDTRTVKCDSCGAEFTLKPDVHAGECPFCAQRVVADPGTHRLIRPAALLPFGIEAREARERVAAWLKGLWFAPTKLKAYARTEGRLAGMYLPYWTYDSFTHTDYTGQQGTIYTEPVRVQAVVNGRRVAQTKMVQKVRWRPARGRVERHFDDVLVLASSALPTWMTDRLEPWDLHDLRPYAPDCPGLVGGLAPDPEAACRARRPAQPSVTLPSRTGRLAPVTDGTLPGRSSSRSEARIANAIASLASTGRP